MSFIFIIIPIPCKTSSHISYPGGLIPLKTKISNVDNVVKRYVNLRNIGFHGIITMLKMLGV